MEDRSTLETYFGSFQVDSVAADFALDDYLRKPKLDELGRPAGWLGAYLSRLYAIDLFFGNPDRNRRNLMLKVEGFNAQLCAFDFASCNLSTLKGLKFPIASDATVQLGRQLQRTHGFVLTSANEALDKVESLSLRDVAGYLESMPVDWMNAEQRNEISELWSDRRITERLQALRSGLGDGSLL